METEGAVRQPGGSVVQRSSQALMKYGIQVNDSGRKKEKNDIKDWKKSF